MWKPISTLAVLFFKFLFEDISVSVLQAVFTFLDIDTLDFRSKARELVDSFHEVQEVFNSRLGPCFTGVYADDSWRIGESAFQSRSSFSLGKVYEFAMPLMNSYCAS